MRGRVVLLRAGRKAPAGDVYLGPNLATDLWHVKKVNPQSMIHLTEKPVELVCGQCSIRCGRARTCWTCSGAAEAPSSAPSKRPARRFLWS